MRSILILLNLSLITLINVHVAMAAKAHDIVEKVFILKGKDAQNVAELLGLSPEIPARIELPWSRQAFARNCSWSQGQAKIEPPFVRCEDIVVPSNKFIYSIGSEPELKIEGYWLDESTGSGANFNRFTFGMSLPPPDDVERGAWEKLNKAFNEKINLSKRGDRGELVITTIEDTNPRIILTRYGGSGDEAGAIYISIDFDSPTQHAEKQAKHKECLIENSNLDGGC